MQPIIAVPPRSQRGRHTHVAVSLYSLLPQIACRLTTEPGLKEPALLRLSFRESGQRRKGPCPMPGLANVASGIWKNAVGDHKRFRFTDWSEAE